MKHSLVVIIGSALAVIFFTAISAQFSRQDARLARPSAYPLPSSLPWRMEGGRTGGESSSGHWRASAAQAYIAGQPIGPFRFQARKVLFLRDFRLDLQTAGASSSVGSLLDLGARHVGVDAAQGWPPSEVETDGLHVDIRDERGRLVCCLRATSAEWAPSRQGEIRLRGVSLIDASHGEARAVTAVLRDRESSLEADDWQSVSLSLPHEEALGAGACPLVFREPAARDRGRTLRPDLVKTSFDRSTRRLHP